MNVQYHNHFVGLLYVFKKISDRAYILEAWSGKFYDPFVTSCMDLVHLLEDRFLEDLLLPDIGEWENLKIYFSEDTLRLLTEFTLILTSIRDKEMHFMRGTIIINTPEWLEIMSIAKQLSIQLEQELGWEGKEQDFI
jgi:hypothetical protein